MSISVRRGEYSDVLLPGLIAPTAFLTGLQTSAFPLVIDFAYTKEIEDRLLAPLPTDLVAIEKIVFSPLRALVAAVLMFPISLLVLGSIPGDLVRRPHAGPLPRLGSLVGVGDGDALGTFGARRTGSTSSSPLVFTPLLFTGSSQYPWQSLDQLRWFQVVCALNPLTYVSEGLRAAMVPEVPHMPPLVCIVCCARRSRLSAGEG